jgi:hypothetical protein
MAFSRSFGQPREWRGPLPRRWIPIWARSVVHAPQFVEESHITNRIKYANYCSYLTVLRTSRVNFNTPLNGRSSTRTPTVSSAA